MVTISNGFLQLFSLDKNYFNYSLVVEQLKTEGWQYFGLSGKYEDHLIHDKESYKDFCKAVENIKRKQIETEFQGKGNNAKKKEKPFDFNEEMTSFMKRSQETKSKIEETVNDTLDDTLDDMVDGLKATVEMPVVTVPPPINSDYPVPPPINSDDPVTKPLKDITPNNDPV